MSAQTAQREHPGLAHIIGDPGGAALFTFGLALSWVFVAEVLDHDAKGALVFGLLVGGIGQTLGGIIAILRRDNYLGNLLLTYGLWLIGFHVLSVSELGSTSARGWWSFALVIPSLFLVIPAIKMRNVAIISAFVFLIALEVVLGLSLVTENASLNPLVGWLAFLSALPIYYLAYERLMHAVEPQPAPEERTATEPVAGGVFA
ncbi:GPR1/FUN34/YaaH family transporter [Gordonia hydrophobica]|uniref:GPR1/FUN34/YaaH family transporter n=1 Tax=Gordonia hydrophobica TaxID=40516 RepID=A0ABZ2TY10_9ACTN|nr:GPR1/FUN34/YaaH family transporter [Gordonia hydrophobica]MBM7366946.1 succinate-acetate transporter protein [Gordonia hydrophobica]